MPLKIIKNISISEKIAVWEITEQEAELLSPLKLTNNEKKILTGFGNKTRRLQWLAIRNLLKMFHPSGILEYSLTGKPYLADNMENISVSHTGKYAAISLNKSGATGIDIEAINNRILKIEGRFVNEMEKNYLTTEMRVEQLCMIWSAKEVLFKMSEWIPMGQDTPGISFKENFFVKSFVLGDKGELETEVNRKNVKSIIRMEFLKFDNHILVYSKNSEL